MTFPAEIQINAWCDGDVRGKIADDLLEHILKPDLVAEGTKLPLEKPSLKNWRDPSVGWGLVLPENTALEPALRATSIDACKPIRDLHADRGGPVFRVGPDWQPGYLRRYNPDGTPQDVSLASGRFGNEPNAIPRYLLIVGAPDVIPWDVQYNLHHERYVGRLDLDEVGLRHYVKALLQGFANRSPQKAHSLVWSVDHGRSDITHLMRRTVGRPLHKLFAGDDNAALASGARYLSKADATHRGLARAIAAHRPSLIVTTSHGATAPINDAAMMRDALGLMVDAQKTVLDPGLLGGESRPSGAVWFAQACCSAGATSKSGYDGILDPSSKADRVLRAVAACGDISSPLPRALLGARDPLAAFVGHVEPTFDWTLKDNNTGQCLTTPLLDTFYQELFTGRPIGMAMTPIRATGSTLIQNFDQYQERLVNDDDETVNGLLLSTKLTARDTRSIVLLGDPTVTVYP